MNKQSLIAIITGASRGIGFAVAKYLSERGYRLLLLSKNPAKIAEALNKLKGDHEAHAVDVADTKSLNAIIEQFIKKEQHIDLLFNSPGYVKSGTSYLDSEEFKKMVDINLIGTFNAISAVVPYMEKKTAILFLFPLIQEM